MLKIVKIQATSDYLLKVRFQNGKTKNCDITPFMDKGAFTELKDISLFKKFVNTGFSVEWNNELDLSSDTLYAIGK